MRRFARLSGLLFPVGQLGLAAAALTVWFLLAQTDTSRDQVTAVMAYTWGTTVGLLLTLGLPFVLPNAFKGLPVEQRHGNGPWSQSIAFGRDLAGLALVMGLAVSLLPRVEHWLGLALVFASVLSLSMLVAQIARITRSFPMMLLSGVGQVMLPFSWIISSVLHGAAYARSLISVALLAVCWVLLARQTKDLGAGARRRSGVSVSLRALPLLPHLLAFGVLLQGPRLIATLNGSPKLLLVAHTAMLVFNGGATFLAAANSMLSVDIQTSDSKQFAANARRYGWSYAGLGAMCSCLCIVAMFSARALGFSAIASLSPWSILAIAASLAAIATYYAGSATALRANQTWVLAMSSVTGVCALAAAYASTHNLWLALMTGTFALAICVSVAQQTHAHSAGRSSCWVPALSTVSLVPIVFCALVLAM